MLRRTPNLRIGARELGTRQSGPAPGETLLYLRAFVLICLALLTTGVVSAAQDPRPGPDSREQTGVPKGEVLKFTFNGSKVFPGTVRDYWIYIPRQYRPDRPACVYVNQDGVGWQAPTVFDNLIHKGEMPITIGVFVMHGRVPAADPAKALDRFNRSYEYDGLGDAYARFLLDELLPDVETKSSADGRPIRLSRRAADRAIGGGSSGAICAFTAAWERPDAFSRVFSAIGTYVSLRGGDRYPSIIRKYEPRPLRIFLQDGAADQNIYGGDWWFANQMMERALVFAGYEVEHAWGEGGHNGQHGTAVFPDAMRFLWKGWPVPPGIGKSRNDMLNRILDPAQGWTVDRGLMGLSTLAAGANGAVWALPPGGGFPRRVDTAGAAALPRLGQSARVTALAEAPGRATLTAQGSRLEMLGRAEKDKRLPLKGPVAGLAVTASGLTFATVSGPGGGLFVLSSRGTTRIAVPGAVSLGAVCLSPDQTLLYVADPSSHGVYSLQVSPDGAASHAQRYFHLHAADTEEHAAPTSLAVDREGRLYVGTNLGVQVCDQAGRVNVILPAPGGSVTGLAFGGASRDTLFAVAGGKLYRRVLRTVGAFAGEAPLKPAAPRL